MAPPTTSPWAAVRSTSTTTTWRTHAATSAAAAAPGRPKAATVHRWARPAKSFRIATARAIPTRSNPSEMKRENNMVYALFSLGVLAAIGAVYGAAIGYLWFRQERLLFEPTPLSPDEKLVTDA